MMCWGETFGEVVCQIFSTGHLVYVRMRLFDSVLNQVVPYFYRFLSSLIHAVVGDFGSACVGRLDGFQWLWMTEIMYDIVNYLEFLGIME